MPAGSQAHHLGPLFGASYFSQLEMMVATLNIPLERRNKLGGRTEKPRIWDITDRTVRTWLSEAVEAAAADEVYMKVFAPDVAARHRVQFQMPAAEVVSMLKGHG